MKPFCTLLLESFRGLKSQLIFWITLGLSLLVALIFLAIGFDDKGVTFAGFSILEDDFLSDKSPFKGLIYKSIFSNLVAGAWLTWIAIILALVSCAPIYPNTMTEGGAGMVMTKGVSRLQIFIAKFVGSLFFVLIQVGLFVLIVFIAFKWRLGEWHPQLFWYVPAVLLVFVSLYSFLVLIAVKTRSVLTALLLTILVWGISGILGWTEGFLRGQLIVNERFQDSSMVENAPEPTVTEETEGEEPATETPGTEVVEKDPDPELDPAPESKPRSRSSNETMKKWHGVIRAIHSFFPKNGPIMQEAEKTLLMDELENMSFDLNSEEGRENAEEMEEQRKALNFENSSFYTIWSSVLFAVVMLSLAAFSFCRRDY